MKHSAYRAANDLVIAVHTDQTPLQPEWDSMLAMLRRLPDLERARILAVTEGGGPNTLQREQFNQLLNGRQVRIAVVSDSRVVRGIATAISWFNPQIRVFPSRDLERALQHLAVPAHEQRGVLELVTEARGELATRAAG